MEILARPSDILAALFPRAAVATRRSTANGTDKKGTVIPRLRYFGAEKFRRANEETR